VLPCVRRGGGSTARSRGESGLLLSRREKEQAKEGGLLLRVLLLVLPDLQVAAAPMKREERVRLWCRSGKVEAELLLLEEPAMGEVLFCWLPQGSGTRQQGAVGVVGGSTMEGAAVKLGDGDLLVMFRFRSRFRLRIDLYSRVLGYWVCGYANGLRLEFNR